MATFDELLQKYDSWEFRSTAFEYVTDKYRDDTGKDIYNYIQITFDDISERNISADNIRKLKDIINEFVDNGFAVIFQGSQSSLSSLLKEDTVGDKGAIKQIVKNDIPRSYNIPNPKVQYVQNGPRLVHWAEAWSK